jgi:hypothetical protein
MSNIPYAPVTCLDTAVSTGPNDATIIVTDYRYAGAANYSMNFIGTLASIGTGDSVSLQVSPDYDPVAPAGAMWQSVEVFTSTQFNGSLNGPWVAVRFIKPGVQTGKVVALTAGKHTRRNIQG